MSESGQSEYVRVTIDVPEDTLKLLDQMKDFAGYASRGRTIQAMVDAMTEMAADSNGMRALVTEWQQNAPNFQKAPPTEQFANVMVYLTRYDAWVGNIIRRLSRFVKIR